MAKRRKTGQCIFDNDSVYCAALWVLWGFSIPDTSPPYFGQNQF